MLPRHADNLTGKHANVTFCFWLLGKARAYAVWIPNCCLPEKCLIGPADQQLWAHRGRIYGCKRRKIGHLGVWSGCFRGRFPPTAAYVVLANAAPFSDPGLVLGGIRTLLPRPSPVVLLCARSSSHRLRLGIRPLERSRWTLGPETIFRPFSVDCRAASRTAARACSRSCGSTWVRRSLCGVVARACVYGGSSCWTPCRRRSLRFRPHGGMGELSHGVASSCWDTQTVETSIPIVCRPLWTTCACLPRRCCRRSMRWWPVGISC